MPVLVTPNHTVPSNRESRLTSARYAASTSSPAGPVGTVASESTAVVVMTPILPHRADGGWRDSDLAVAARWVSGPR